MDSTRALKKVDKKKELCFEIAAAVRKIQKQYIGSVNAGAGGHSDGGRMEELTLGMEELTLGVERLCVAVEAVFLHELKNTKMQCVLWRDLKKTSIPPEPTFWVFIEPLVSDEIKTQILVLRNCESDVRKCRSWVRLMLLKNRMVSFLEDLQRHPGLVRFHYGEGALLRDTEQSEIIIQLLRGLSVLQLPYDYTSSRLDSWDPAVLVLAQIWEGSEKEPGKSTPQSIASPGNSSPSIQRVSPPASDFDFEGVAIIDMAMGKYSRRKASKTNTPDSAIISREIAQRLNHTPNRERRGRMEGGSASSVESGGSVFMETEAPYGAMLRSYAKKTEPQVGVAAGNGTGTQGRQEAVLLNRKEREEGSEAVDGVDRENFCVALSLNYEIISSDGSFVESHTFEPHLQQKLVMVEHLVKLVTEKGLDSQGYKCCGCNMDIGLIFGQAKLCKFNGQHYCYECHRDDERLIPARVLFNWDFRQHKVSLSSCEFLDSVEMNPVLDVQEINEALYLYIPALADAQKLRRQCKHLKDYLITCKDREALDQFRRRLKSSHIYDDIHKYSIKDLVEVNSGAFNDRLRKLVKFGMKHVKQCQLCSQKGFICEVCHDSQVLYPFNLTDTSQCELCKAVYHKSCSPERGNCPKCLRLRKRANSLDLVN